MNIKEQLLESYTSNVDETEKALIVNAVIGFLQEAFTQQAAEMAKLTAECESLRAKVSRANDLITEAQAEAVKARRATVNDIRKKLQGARDRVAAIVATSATLGLQINSDGDRTVLVDTLNNIIASTGIIADVLAEAGLWDADEERPNITLVEAKTPRKKTGKRKKPDMSDEQIQF